ncbi:MAG TPA: GIY-YIG nuclease family protein [Gemmatimonadales bacterium]|jgi:excinuclease ABC subunit C
MSGLELNDQPSSSTSLAGLKRRVQSLAPKKPGIYEFLDPTGGTIYVGKAKELRTRLLSYFNAALDSKGAQLVRSAADIRWRTVPSEFAALLEEQRLITTLRPRYNVVGNSYRASLAFIKITKGNAPRLMVSESAQDSAALYFGPFRGRGATAAATRTLSDLLGLRDCAERVTMRFADQPSLFDAPIAPACIRHELGTCLGPCAARCSMDRYAGAVGSARAFLEGRAARPLDRILDVMADAAVAQEFERAALWRDRFEELTWLFAALARLRAAIEGLSFVYSAQGSEPSLDRLYCIRHGVIRGEAAPPTTPIERAAFAETARRLSVEEGPAPAARNGAEMGQLLLVMSWFRRNPEEYERTTPFRRWIEET